VFFTSIIKIISGLLQISSNSGLHDFFRKLLNAHTASILPHYIALMVSKITGKPASDQAYPGRGTHRVRSICPGKPYTILGDIVHGGGVQPGVTCTTHHIGVLLIGINVDDIGAILGLVCRCTFRP
jgi:hypothetical protein